MAVARLTPIRVQEVLRARPGGLPRAELLDHFAALYITPRSKPGAKGRLGARLSRVLEKLLRKGEVQLDALCIHLTEEGKRRASRPEGLPPPMSAPLRRAWFEWLMAEDRPRAGGRKQVDALRSAFIRQALDEGWTSLQIADFLGDRKKGKGFGPGSAPLERSGV